MAALHGKECACTSTIPMHALPICLLTGGDSFDARMRQEIRAAKGRGDLEEIMGYSIDAHAHFQVGAATGSAQFNMGTP